MQIVRDLGCPAALLELLPQRNQFTDLATLTVGPVAVVQQSIDRNAEGFDTSPGLFDLLTRLEAVPSQREDAGRSRRREVVGCEITVVDEAFERPIVQPGGGTSRKGRGAGERATYRRLARAVGAEHEVDLPEAHHALALRRITSSVRHE